MAVGVEQALGNRFGGQRAGLRQRKFIEIDVGAVGRVDVLCRDKADVSRKDLLDRGNKGLAWGRSRIAAGTHDAWRVVGVRQPQRMANFVEGDIEPGAPISTVAVIDARIHDHFTAAGDTTHRSRSNSRGDSAHVTGNDRQAGIRRFDELDSQVPAIHIENLTGVGLLLLGNRIVQNVSEGISAIDVLEVVVKNLNSARYAGRRSTGFVALTSNSLRPEISIARCARPAGQGGIGQIAQGGNRAADRKARRAERAQIGGGRKAGRIGGLDERIRGVDVQAV